MLKKICLGLMVVSSLFTMNVNAKNLICIDVGNFKGSIMSADRNYVPMQDGMTDVKLTFAIDPEQSTVDFNDGNPIKLTKITSTIFERTVLLPENKGTILTLWSLSPKDKKVFFNENKIGENGSVKSFVGDIISYNQAEKCDMDRDAIKNKGT